MLIHPRPTLNAFQVFDKFDDPYAPYYPGDDVVDWVGITVYSWGLQYPFGENQLPQDNYFVNRIRGARLLVTSALNPQLRTIKGPSTPYNLEPPKQRQFLRGNYVGPAGDYRSTPDFYLIYCSPQGGLGLLVYLNLPLIPYNSCPLVAKHGCWWCLLKCSYNGMFDLYATHGFLKPL